MSASRWRDERGLTTPIIALIIGTLVLMVSFAVDLGRQRADRRLAQAGADVVALDMMRVVQGRTFETLSTDPAVLAEVTAALTRTAQDNGFINAVGSTATAEDPRITALEWGTVPANRGGSAFVRYELPADAARVPTAVRITAERTTEYFFQPGEGTVLRTAIAAFPQPMVDLEIGSVAAGFQPNIPNSATLDATVTALNARLAAHFGTTLPNPGSAGFDLVGYRGLAAADVELRRVAANAGFATPNEMLDSDMTVGQFFSATATALDQQAAEGDPNAAAAATQLRRFESQMGVTGTNTMRLGDYMTFDQGGDDAAAAGTVNVLDLLAGSADVVNGDNFVSYQFTPTIPGVAVANVSQYLVSRPSIGFGLPLTGAVENTQARFQVNLQVAPLAGMTQAVTIPLVIEAANALGTVQRMDCADPLTGSEAEIGVTTSGARVRIGTATDLSADTLQVEQAVIIQGGGLTVSTLLSLGLNLLQITGLDLGQQTRASASASVLGGTSQHVFQPYVDPNPFQRAPGGIGATSIGATLSNSLSATLGNTVLPATAQTNLKNQLGYVFNNVEALIIEPLLKSSGVAIAGADLQARNLQCDSAGLKLVG